MRSYYKMPQNSKQFAWTSKIRKSHKLTGFRSLCYEGRRIRFPFNIRILHQVMIFALTYFIHPVTHDINCHFSVGD